MKNMKKNLKTSMEGENCPLDEVLTLSHFVLGPYGGDKADIGTMIKVIL